jgi:hypothetical protein
LKDCPPPGNLMSMEPVIIYTVSFAVEACPPPTPPA